METQLSYTNMFFAGEALWNVQISLGKRKNICRLREREKEKQQIQNAVPQQRNCQASTVNVVKSALEDPQEKGAKKVHNGCYLLSER